MKRIETIEKISKNYLIRSRGGESKMIKQTVAVVVAIALVLMTVAGTAQARFGDPPYQDGYHDGCGDHIKGNPFLGPRLFTTPEYIRGYYNGWNECRG
jgi:hypothetical protein